LKGNHAISSLGTGRRASAGRYHQVRLASAGNSRRWSLILGRTNQCPGQSEWLSAAADSDGQSRTEARPRYIAAWPWALCQGHRVVDRL